MSTGSFCNLAIVLDSHCLIRAIWAKLDQKRPFYFVRITFPSDFPNFTYEIGRSLKLKSMVLFFWLNFLFFFFFFCPKFKHNRSVSRFSGNLFLFLKLVLVFQGKGEFYLLCYSYVLRSQIKNFRHPCSYLDPPNPNPNPG